jgi:hypothetical protein
MANRSATALHIAAHAKNLHADIIKEYAGHSVRMDKLLTDTEETRRSRMLTPEGRMDAVQRMTSTARAEILPSLEKRLQQHRQRLQQLTNDAIPKRTKTQETLLLEMEVRNELRERGNDPLQNFTILQDAIAAGDAITIGAILDAPPFFRTLTDEFRQQAVQQLVAKSPLAGEVQEVRDSLAVHVSLYEAIVHDIETAAGDGQAPGPKARGSAAPIESLAR